MMLKFFKRFKKAEPKLEILLDGTPGTFLRSLRKYSAMEYTRLLIVEANKPWTDTPCVMCDETGGEYTIYGGVLDHDEDGPVVVDFCWAVHEKHFVSSVGEDDDNQELQQHGVEGRKARL